MKNNKKRRQKGKDGKLGVTSYRARYRDTQRKLRTQSFARKTDAENWLDEQNAALTRGDWIDPDAGLRPFGEWWADWWKARPAGRPSTQARDESYARNHILPAFENVALADIDHLAAQAWITSLTEKGLAPGTVRKAGQLARGAIKAAMRVPLIGRDPFDGVMLPKIEDYEMRFLEPGEVAALAETIAAGFGPFVWTGAYCGLRLGELGGLRRRRIDLVRRRIEVAEIVVEVKGHHHFGPPKTKAGRRMVPIPGFVGDVLESHVAGLGPDDLVFPAQQGGPLRASLFRRRIWQPACVRAGVGEWVRNERDTVIGYTGLRIHDLRHTAVAFWIEAGAKPNDIARRAGHRSVVTLFDRYGHLLDGSDDRGPTPSTPWPARRPNRRSSSPSMEGRAQGALRAREGANRRKPARLGAAPLQAIRLVRADFGAVSRTPPDPVSFSHGRGPPFESACAHR